MLRTIYCGIIMLALLLATTACDNSPAESELPTAIATFTTVPTTAAVAAVTTTPARIVDTPAVTTAGNTPAAQVAPAVTLTPTLAATATVTTPPPAEPTQSPTLAPTPIPTVTPTAAPTTAPTTAPTATLAETATSASPPAADAVGAEGTLPPAIAALLPTADAVAGAQLTVSKGCTVCHALAKDVRVVGPSWYSVGATAGERVPGQSAEFYLYNSILHPNDFVVPDYLSNLMPGNFGELLTEQDLADTISYLLTLQGQ